MRIAMIGQKGMRVGVRGGGGVERHVAELSSRLGAMGHEVVVYARSQDQEDGAHGVEVRVRPSIRTKRLEAISHTFICILDALFGRFDVIHFHGVGPSTLAWMVRLCAPSVTVVTTFHSRDQFHQKWGWFARRFLQFGEWAAVRFPHVTIAVSHAIAVVVREHYGKEVIYIPNGADIKTVTQTDQLASFGLEPHSYVLSVSRLEPHKGQAFLIEAFLSLCKQEPELMQERWLVIVGAPRKGSGYEEQLRLLANQHPRILFLGFQEGEVLAQLFAHAQLFVHASEAEGLPVVVLEAMSYGLPVLVSDIAENLEATHQTGFTFLSGDVDDLTHTLESLFSHPEQMEAQRGSSRSIIETAFNWDTIAQETLGAYRSIRH